MKIATKKILIFSKIKYKNKNKQKCYVLKVFYKKYKFLLKHNKICYKLIFFKGHELKEQILMNKHVCDKCNFEINFGLR